MAQTWEYNQIVDTVSNYYNTDASTVWNVINDYNLSPEQVGDLLPTVDSFLYGQSNSGYGAVKAADGSVLSWNNVGSVQSNTAALPDLELNSNAGSVSQGQFQVPANSSYGGQNGTFQASSGVTGGSSGASFVQSQIMPAVAAAGLGISLGKIIDSALYNANPDFWDNAGLSSLNPETWNSITADMSDAGWEGVNKRAFNALFGLNPQSGTSQMYIDENAAAYIAQYMQENGVFATGETETISGDSWAQSQRWYNNIVFPIPTGGSPAYTRKSTRYTRTYDANTVGYCQIISNQIYLNLCSKTRITWTDSSGGSGETISASGIVNGKEVYAGFLFLGDISNHEVNVPVYTASIDKNLAYVILYGNTDTSSPVEGIATQDGATTPDFSQCQTPQDYLDVLRNTYPNMFANPVTQTVAQPDGSVVTHTYIPVGTPSGTGTQTTTNPATTGQSQTNTQVDTSAATQELLQTIVDLIAKTTEQPPDTGDGDTPTIVPPVGQASSLFAIYNPTQAELNQFGSWLWSSNFVDQLLKLFNDPMQSIIGLHKIFAPPTISGTSTIHVGYLDSGVSSNTVGAQYTDINCGSVRVSEQFGNVFDYSDTDVRLYLPFIGIVPLDVMDVMRGTVSVIYHVDVITGACLAEVRVTRDASGGTLYQYAGDAAVRYPISSGSYMGVVSGVLGVVGGIASGIMSGGATLPLMAGAAGAMAGAKTHVQHSGSFAGNAGAMGAKKPYLILERPQTAIAKNYKAYQGIGANVVQSVGDMRGYFKMTDVRLNSITSASDSELESIRAALEQGVIA